MAWCVATNASAAPAAPLAPPPAPRVVAVIDGTGDGDGAVLANRLAAALVLDDGLTGLGDAARARALVAPLTDENAGLMAEARAALEAARDAVARFDDGNALGATAAGQTRLLGAVPTPAVRKLLGDLVFTEGLARIGGGDQPGALAAFAAVRRLEPQRTLDPARFPPEVIAAYDGAAGATAANAAIAIEVEGAATDGSTQVWIDGAAIGAPPITAAVAPGVHFVAVTGPDVATAGARVAIAADQRAPLRLVAAPVAETTRLARLRRRLLEAPDDATRAAAIAAIARSVGTAAAVVVVRHGDGLAVRLWRERAPLGPSVAYARQVARDLVLPLAPPRPRIALEPVKPIAPPSSPWWERRWVRVVAAAGAVVLVGGAITLGATRDEGSSTLGTFGF